MHSFGLFRLSLAENIIIPQGVVDMDKRIATIIGMNLQRLWTQYGLTQEQLAEKVGISTTHMSHIETANTKLSLSVFVDIAEALEVQTDALLFDNSRRSVGSVIGETAAILEECSVMQAMVIKEIVKTAKQAMDAFLWKKRNVILLKSEWWIY